MKSNRLVLVAMLFLGFAGVARAQEPTTLPDYESLGGGNNNVISAMQSGNPTPGDAYTSLGNNSPIEKNDLFSNSHIDQGLVFYRRSTISVQVFGSADMNFDSQGYVWANEAIVQGGFKASKVFGDAGVITLNVTHAYEKQWTGVTAAQNEGFFSSWFGWNDYTTHKFPGSFWTVAGNIVPMEHNNLLGIGYVQQGVVLHRFSPKSAVVMFVENTAGGDYDKNDWNNYNRTGLGFKAMLPHSLEIGASYDEEKRFISGETAGGFSAFLRIYKGWNLATIFKGGN